MALADYLNLTNYKRTSRDAIITGPHIVVTEHKDGIVETFAQTFPTGKHFVVENLYPSDETKQTDVYVPIIPSTNLGAVVSFTLQGTYRTVRAICVGKDRWILNGAADITGANTSFTLQELLTKVSGQVHLLAAGIELVLA